VRPLYAVLISVVFVFQSVFSQSEINIGSKKFTENVILGEIITQLVKKDETKVNHISELGGTRILWNALLNGNIDVYPEYTGTILEEILAEENIAENELENRLNDLGIGISKPLGFNNTYAIGTNNKLAIELGINNISDLINHPNLKFGFTNEFMNRSDGWPGFRQAYGLPQDNVTGLDHDLAYRGLVSGSIEVIDLYSTDAEIDYYNLKVLKDDLNYFSEYNAVVLYRKELEQNVFSVVLSIKSLEGMISEKLMIQMNSDVKIKGESEKHVAAQFIKSKFGIEPNFTESTFFNRLWYNTKGHLFLVIISLTAAILISIPLGIISFKYKKLGKVVLSITGIIQTIPSLALLVFMIPLLGIGSWPAISALFLYSLLPIIRNTHSGLQDISVDIRESAIVLGLSPLAILKKIELPLSSRSILSGIKTSAVINVGTATLGALIGAGGYGQPILTGIRLDDVPLILEGAVPAALLALFVQWFFDLTEKVIVPKGLQLQ
jgi:osmoprotectant transport system permease protein